MEWISVKHLVMLKDIIEGVRSSGYYLLLVGFLYV